MGDWEGAENRKEYGRTGGGEEGRGIPMPNNSTKNTLKKKNLKIIKEVKHMHS